jgi:gamma-glutamyl hercynylcysteine S-oxide hydrolase
MLGAMWRTQFRQTGGRDAAAALRSALREARDLAREHDGEVKTNLILAGAAEILAVRYAEPGEANTLYYLEGEARWSGGAVVASEPLDDGPGWREVEPDTLMRVDGRGVHLQPLALDRAEAPLQRRLIA